MWGAWTFSYGLSQNLANPEPFYHCSTQGISILAAKEEVTLPVVSPTPESDSDLTILKYHHDLGLGKNITVTGSLISQH